MKKAALPRVIKKKVTPAADDNTVARQAAEDLGGPLRLILTSLLIFIASQVIAAFIAELSLSLIHPNGGMNLDDSIGAQFVYVALAEGLAAWLVIRIIRRRGLGLG